MSHDYDPNWDYVVIEADAEDKHVIDSAIAEMKKEILPVLGLNSFSVFIAEPLSFHEGESVGIYINGTSSSPVIGIDIETLRDFSARCGVDWIDQLRATMIHELAHAYEEATGNLIHDEAAVENFARKYVVDGVVDVSFLKTKSKSKLKIF